MDNLEKNAHELELALKDVENQSDEWNAAAEDVLAEIAEKAASFRWLHNRCSVMYSKLDMKFQLPIIVLSSLTGGVSLSLGAVVPEENQQAAQTAVGCVNLLVGIIGSIAQYIKPGALSEANRTSSIAWGKLSRKLQTEMALPPRNRTEPQDIMLKETLATYDNLIEQSPTIREKVLAEFRQKFGSDPPNPKLTRPEICDGIRKTTIYGRTQAEYNMQRRGTGLWTKGLRKIGFGGKKSNGSSGGGSSGDSPNDITVI